jgi:hypothetical protein
MLLQNYMLQVFSRINELFFYWKTRGPGLWHGGLSPSLNGPPAHGSHKTRAAHLMMEGSDSPGEGLWSCSNLGRRFGFGWSRFKIPNHFSFFYCWMLIMMWMAHSTRWGGGGVNQLVRWRHGRPHQSERGGGYGAHFLMRSGPTVVAQDSKLT